MDCDLIRVDETRIGFIFYLHINRTCKINNNHRNHKLSEQDIQHVKAFFFIISAIHRKRKVTKTDSFGNETRLCKRFSKKIPTITT
jgi:hypothetical protein